MVEGKREGKVSNSRAISKCDRHTVGVTLRLVVSRGGPTTDMLTNLAKNGPRNVSIWLLHKIDFLRLRSAVNLPVNVETHLCNLLKKLEL